MVYTDLELTTQATTNPASPTSQLHFSLHLLQMLEHALHAGYFLVSLCTQTHGSATSLYK